jgi:TetR/AcrR family transcriptional regulator
LDDYKCEDSSVSRAPAPDERRRDAERSRERLIAAALEEFAAKGYAGARVKDIAARAGLNPQLITYYFGGKEGLYKAVQEHWEQLESSFADPDVPLDELIARYLSAAIANPRLTRLLVWEGLEAADPDREHAPTPPAGSEDLSDLRRRQAEGELAADLDPSFVHLTFMGAVTLAAAMPQLVRRITGLDPADPEFQRRYAEQLRRIVRHLQA